MQAIKILTEGDEKIKVSDLENQLNLSRRTLLRKFKKQLGYTIEENITVIKFRKALLRFQEQSATLKPTNIAHQSGYYDQADFNHKIKNRSGFTPGELFEQMDIVDDTLFWKK